MTHTLHSLLASYPAPRHVTAAMVRARMDASAPIYVVLDDDPTGTQSVSDLPVLTDINEEDFVWAFEQGAPAVYVMTNSRSLDPADAEEINRRAVRAARSAAHGRALAFVSRSDSTLRGHFPLEPDVICQEIGGVDGVVIVPAFPDAGRITVGGVHYAGSKGSGYEAVGDTEFARDKTFGFRASRLSEWVEEKTGGRVSASAVTVLDLGLIRGCTEELVKVLSRVSGGGYVVADAECEEDLRALSLGLIAAENSGKTFVYRVGPPFVRARIGQDQRDPVRPHELPSTAETMPGGLIVVGSHVALTTAQLDALRETQHPVELEIEAETVLDERRRDAHLNSLIEEAADALERGNVVVRTSRVLVSGPDGDASLAISRAISQAVVDVVRGIVSRVTPRFVIAKGGITSSDVASKGLGIRRARVLGPMLPGIVSAWVADSGPAKSLPYIVFPGNVGDTHSLEAVVSTLCHAKERIVNRIAVVGLGAMGLEMATCLHAHFDVVGFDPMAARSELANMRGIATANTAREAVKGADAVLVAVRNRAQLDELLDGIDGIREVLVPGSVLVLTSTIGVADVKEVAASLERADIGVVDAPVSGGPTRAGNGDLLIVVGATPETLGKADELLNTLASTLVVVGDEPGAGQAMKTVNQLLCGVHIAAAGEALALAKALGIDQKTALDALMAGAAASFMLGDRGPRAIEASEGGEAEVRSRLDIFVKDMGIVTAAAKAAGMAVPVAAAAEQEYLLGLARGLAAADDSSVIRVVTPGEENRP